MALEVGCGDSSSRMHAVEGRRGCGLVHQQLLMSLVIICGFATSNASAAQFSSADVQAVEQLESSRILQAVEYLDAEEWESGIDVLRSFIEQDSTRLVLANEVQIRDSKWTRFVPADEFANQLAVQYSLRSDDFLRRYQDRIEKQVERIDTDLPPFSKFQEQTRIDRGTLQRAFLAAQTENALRRTWVRNLEAARFSEAKRQLMRLMPPEMIRFEEGPQIPLLLRGKTFELPEDLPRLLTSLGTSTEASRRAVLQLDQPYQLSARLDSWHLSFLPEASLDPAECLANWLLISILAGEPTQAETGLVWLQHRYPNAKGSLLNEEGDLAELLSYAIETHRMAAETHRMAAGQSLELELGQTGPFVVEELPEWQVEYFPNQSESEVSLRTPVGLARLDRGYPLVVDGKVIWADQFRVRAVSIEDGTPVWKLGTDTDLAAGRKGVIWRSNLPTSELSWSVAGPLRAVESKQGVALAYLRQPKSESSANSNGKLELVGFDVRNNGVLMPGFPLESPSREEAFTGMPLLDGNRLYLTVQRNTRQGELARRELVCLELRTRNGAESFSVRWRTQLGLGGERLSEGNDQSIGQAEVPGAELLVREGIVYAITQAGLIAAVESDTGKVRWAQSYQSRKPVPRRNDDEHPVASGRCLITADEIVVAPDDSNDLCLLDRYSGKLIWTAAKPPGSTLLAVTPNHVIVEGKQLRWYSRLDGRCLAQYPDSVRGSRPRRGQASTVGAGKAVCFGSLILWPTRERVVVMSLEPTSFVGADGREWQVPQVLQSIDLEKRGVVGGSLVLTQEYLLVGSPRGIAAFSWHASTKEQALRK